MTSEAKEKIAFNKWLKDNDLITSEDLYNYIFAQYKAERNEGFDNHIVEANIRGTKIGTDIVNRYMK